MTHFIVWNQAKTEGFVTTDRQLAYEVRKSADSNCYYGNGDGTAFTAMAFAQQWGEDNCTTEVLPAAALQSLDEFDKIQAISVEKKAAERIAALLALPLPAGQHECGMEGVFDPWDLFPLYGSYSDDFDQCAIAVLQQLQARQFGPADLAAQMFQEMLCNLHLCDYGTSPRCCFPTPEFRPLVPALLEKWIAFSRIQWAEESES